MRNVWMYTTLFPDRACYELRGPKQEERLCELIVELGGRWPLYSIGVPRAPLDRHAPPVRG